MGAKGIGESSPVHTLFWGLDRRLDETPEPARASEAVGRNP